MRKTRVLLAALAGVILAGAVAAVPASAQYYGGGYYPPPSPSYDEYGRPYGYRRPPPPDYEYGYRRRAPISQFCETGRGGCYSRPSPVGAPCRCDIPGFGLKRGIVQ